MDTISLRQVGVPESCLVLGWIDKDERGDIKVNLTLGNSKGDSEIKKELEGLIRFFLNNKEKFYRAL